MTSNYFARAIRCWRFSRGFGDSLEPMDLDLYHSIVVPEIYTIRNSYIHQVKPAVSLKIIDKCFQIDRTTTKQMHLREESSSSSCNMTMILY